MEEILKTKEKANSGITLIALVITIIVLLILAGVSIAMLTGQNGILTQAQNSKTTTELKSAEEKVKLAIMAARSQSETGALDADKLIAEITNNYGGTASKTNDGFPVNATVDGKNFKIDGDGNITGGTTPTPEPANKISNTESYVGYYADIDGDGTVDGVIYADLAIGGSGTWKGSMGTYAIPKVKDTSNLKEYYISKKDYKANDGFGTKDVISPIGTGIERFYIIALTDIDGKINEIECTWYSEAYRLISDYSSITSTDFGQGKQNTITMISKWNSKVYGDQSKNDMWGKIQTEVNKGWFVPSRAEWAACANELKILGSNYVKFGFSKEYWSSSLITEEGAYIASISGECINGSNLDVSKSIRLSATF